MEFLITLVNDMGGHIPNWLMWAFLGLVLVLVVGFYFFSKQLKKVAVKHDVDFDKVDGLVKMLAMLAVRLYVVKKGVEDTQKVERIKNVAEMVDALYPTDSSIRLSQLIDDLDNMSASKFVGGDYIKHKEIVVDLKENILHEVVKVGDKVNDNEHDPIINPQDISKWIKKGLSAVNVVTN